MVFVVNSFFTTKVSLAILIVMGFSINVLFAKIPNEVMGSQITAENPLLQHRLIYPDNQFILDSHNANIIGSSFYNNLNFNSTFYGPAKLNGLSICLALT